MTDKLELYWSLSKHHDWNWNESFGKSNLKLFCRQERQAPRARKRFMISSLHSSHVHSSISIEFCLAFRIVNAIPTIADVSIISPSIPVRNSYAHKSCIYAMQCWEVILRRNHIYQFVDVNDCCANNNNNQLWMRGKWRDEMKANKKTLPHSTACINETSKIGVSRSIVRTCVLDIEYTWSRGWMAEWRTATYADVQKYVETINGIRSRYFVRCWKIVPGDTDLHWCCCCTDVGGCRYFGILSNRCEQWMAPNFHVHR